MERKIDLTPSWLDVLGMARAFAIGAENQKAILGIMGELERPCRFLDQHNAEVKGRMEMTEWTGFCF